MTPQVLLDCVYELAMLLVIWLMGVFIFGTIMFYIEHEQENTKFESIMHSCWWSVVSMSTVCYSSFLYSIFSVHERFSTRALILLHVQ